MKMRHREIVAARMQVSAGCERHTQDSRQQKAARERAVSFAEITKKYGPEPRRARRGIALTLVRTKRKADRKANETTP